MAALTWTNITVSLGALKPWTHNPRMSTKAQAKRILQSFERFGQVQPVAVGPEFEVYDGHQRLSALLTLHGKDYRIDARQSSRALADAERRELVVSLHAGAVGSWDWDALSGWQAEELQSWGMDAELLKGWKRDVGALDNFLKSEQVDAEPQDIPEQYAVLITCKSEQEQNELLERFLSEGIECRALLS
jgi:hypothetical protein